MFLIATLALAIVSPVTTITSFTLSPTSHFAVGPVTAPPRASDRSVTAPDTIPPALVITDSLLLQWHLALVHLYDTLHVHPKLQTLPGLTPLLNGVDCHAWTEPIPRDSMSATDGMSLARGPNTTVVAVIAKTTALAGAIRTAGMTPAAWMATTSTIEQEECASEDFYKIRDSIGHWPVDSTSTLGKNLSYFWGWKKGAQAQSRDAENHYFARLVRIRAYGLEALNYATLKSSSGNATTDVKWGNRMEGWPEIKGRVIDTTGREIPIPQ